MAGRKSGGASPELPGWVEEAAGFIYGQFSGESAGSAGGGGGAAPQTPSETPWLTYGIIAAAVLALYFLLRKKR